LVIRGEDEGVGDGVVGARAEDDLGAVAALSKDEVHLLSGRAGWQAALLVKDGHGDVGVLTSL
jgi:hypothetical protein